MEVESGMIPEPKGLREDRMIREERWADIHHARTVEHWAVSRIAREFDLDRKTVRECLRQPVWKPYTREVRADALLTKHVDFLTGRAPEVRYSARILFQELQKQHRYTGGYDTVRRFVHPLQIGALAFDASQFLAQANEVATGVHQFVAQRVIGRRGTVGTIGHAPVRPVPGIEYKCGILDRPVTMR
jgi:hypothetical protein